MPISSGDESMIDGQPGGRRARFGSGAQPADGRRLIAQGARRARHGRGGERVRMSRVALGGVVGGVLVATESHQLVGEDVLVPRVAGGPGLGEHVDQCGDPFGRQGDGRRRLVGAMVAQRGHEDAPRLGGLAGGERLVGVVPR